MENLSLVLNMIQEDKIKKILMLAEIKGKSPVEIINTASLTYFAKTLKPTLKAHQTIYLESGKKISANMMRLKQIGKNPWKDGTHGMPNHLAEIFRSVDENEVNKAILEYAYRLIDVTLQDIFENASKGDAKKYLEALDEENFLYVMLQIAVRLVGMDLQNKGVKLENKTLDYMLNVMKEDQANIKKVFKQCVSTGTKEVAVKEYYAMLERYLSTFENKKILLTGKEVTNIGIELSLLADVGEETLFVFLGYLLEYLKDKYQTQKQLFSKELITVK